MRVEHPRRIQHFECQIPVSAELPPQTSRKLCADLNGARNGPLEETPLFRSDSGVAVSKAASMRVVASPERCARICDSVARVSRVQWHTRCS